MNELICHLTKKPGTIVEYKIKDVFLNNFSQTNRAYRKNDQPDDYWTFIFKKHLETQKIFWFCEFQLFNQASALKKADFVLTNFQIRISFYLFRYSMYQNRSFSNVNRFVPVID